MAATDHLERCLASLGSDLISEVLVVAPQSATESIQMLERNVRVRAIKTARPLSFASAVNLAASEAAGETLLLLNDDTIVESGAIELMANALVSDHSLAIAGAQLFNIDGSVQPSLYTEPSWRAVVEVLMRPIFRHWPLLAHARFPYSKPPVSTPAGVWVSGAALMISRSIYQEVGGLDERYFHGIEDAALCRAVRERGYRVAAIPGARVIHEGGVSGFRNASDSEQVARALLHGTQGWIRYWRTYRNAGRIRLAVLRSSFLFFGLSRLAAFTFLAAVTWGPRRQAHRLRRDAFRLYVRLGLRAVED